jgi:hypothetical protein
LAATIPNNWSSNPNSVIIKFSSVTYKTIKKTKYCEIIINHGVLIFMDFVVHKFLHCGLEFLLRKVGSLVVRANQIHSPHPLRMRHKCLTYGECYSPWI